MVALKLHTGGGGQGGLDHSRLPLFLLSFSCLHRPAPFLVYMDPLPTGFNHPPPPKFFHPTTPPFFPIFFFFPQPIFRQKPPDPRPPGPRPPCPPPYTGLRVAALAVPHLINIQSVCGRVWCFARAVLSYNTYFYPCGNSMNIYSSWWRTAASSYSFWICVFLSSIA